ncbi:DUF4062 domain-containing protein [Candidatus Accumulibacter vicinus]|uniref:DUF4062 domain-containing protein n=1 Tax=Candidatus Accumulibacter vicinus TaxID=2954382 RepID=A0A084Y4E5_9PROT|nr:DUF4062 domain-containing protein [Candidatus Accumulibacter vicinus]KFB69589.1 MAG: hypothetical protein CAPSK01_000648 [Candidatus Accumulibacter vicinus]
MPYTATIIPVMIASPGDVTQYRASARDVLHEWNYIHSAATLVALMPVGWETHSSPELGSRPQELINDRVLKDCDLLVGIFWTRLGTPTGSSVSGTAEEIQKHVQAGKPAMLYFCEAPSDLRTVSREQYDALQEFRKWCESQGLIETFLNADEFGLKLRRQLQVVLYKSPYIRQAFEMEKSRRNGFGIPTAIQGPPPDEISALLASLGPEACQLLEAAAADKTGLILAIDLLAGRVIQAGARQFGEMEDRRSMAKWDYALSELKTHNLVQLSHGSSGKESVFELTERGYQVADRLATSGT